jgi:hypothetical protein
MKETKTHKSRFNECDFTILGRSLQRIYHPVSIAMENSPFIDDVPIKTFNLRGISLPAMFDFQISRGSKVISQYYLIISKF